MIALGETYYNKISWCGFTTVCLLESVSFNAPSVCLMLLEITCSNIGRTDGALSETRVVVINK